MINIKPHSAYQSVLGRYLGLPSICVRPFLLLRSNFRCALDSYHERACTNVSASAAIAGVCRRLPHWLNRALIASIMTLCSLPSFPAVSVGADLFHLHDDIFMGGGGTNIQPGMVSASAPAVGRFEYAAFDDVLDAIRYAPLDDVRSLIIGTTSLTYGLAAGAVTRNPAIGPAFGAQIYRLLDVGGDALGKTLGNFAYDAVQSTRNVLQPNRIPLGIPAAPLVLSGDSITSHDVADGLFFENLIEHETGRAISSEDVLDTISQLAIDAKVRQSDVAVRVPDPIAAYNELLMQQHLQAAADYAFGSLAHAIGMKNPDLAAVVGALPHAYRMAKGARALTNIGGGLAALTSPMGLLALADLARGAANLASLVLGFDQADPARIMFEEALLDIQGQLGEIGQNLSNVSRQIQGVSRSVELLNTRLDAVIRIQLDTQASVQELSAALNDMHRELSDQLSGMTAAMRRSEALATIRDDQNLFDRYERDLRACRDQANIWLQRAGRGAMEYQMSSDYVACVSTAVTLSTKVAAGPLYNGAAMFRSTPSQIRNVFVMDGQGARAGDRLVALWPQAAAAVLEDSELLAAAEFPKKWINPSVWRRGVDGIAWLLSVGDRVDLAPAPGIDDVMRLGKEMNQFGEIVLREDLARKALVRHQQQGYWLRQTLHGLWKEYMDAMLRAGYGDPAASDLFFYYWMSDFNWALIADLPTHDKQALVSLIDVRPHVEAPWVIRNGETREVKQISGVRYFQNIEIYRGGPPAGNPRFIDLEFHSRPETRAGYFAAMRGRGDFEYSSIPVVFGTIGVQLPDCITTTLEYRGLENGNVYARENAEICASSDLTEEVQSHLGPSIEMFRRSVHERNFAPGEGYCWVDIGGENSRLMFEGIRQEGKGDRPRRSPYYIVRRGGLVIHGHHPGLWLGRRWFDERAGLRNHAGLSMLLDAHPYLTQELDGNGYLVVGGDERGAGYLWDLKWRIAAYPFVLFRHEVPDSARFNFGGLEPLTYSKNRCTYFSLSGIPNDAVPDGFFLDMNEDLAIWRYREDAFAATGREIEEGQKIVGLPALNFPAAGAAFTFRDSDTNLDWLKDNISELIWEERVSSMLSSLAKDLFFAMRRGFIDTELQVYRKEFEGAARNYIEMFKDWLWENRRPEIDQIVGRLDDSWRAAQLMGRVTIGDCVLSPGGEDVLRLLEGLASGEDVQAFLEPGKGMSGTGRLGTWKELFGVGLLTGASEIGVSGRAEAAESLRARLGDMSRWPVQRETGIVTFWTPPSASESRIAHMAVTAPVEAAIEIAREAARDAGIVMVSPRRPTSTEAAIVKQRTGVVVGWMGEVPLRKEFQRVARAIPNEESDGGNFHVVLAWEEDGAHFSVIDNVLLGTNLTDPDDDIPSEWLHGIELLSGSVGVYSEPGILTDPKLRMANSFDLRVQVLLSGQACRPGLSIVQEGIEALELIAETTADAR